MKYIFVFNSAKICNNKKKWNQEYCKVRIYLWFGTLCVGLIPDMVMDITYHQKPPCAPNSVRFFFLKRKSASPKPYWTYHNRNRSWTVSRGQFFIPKQTLHGSLIPLDPAFPHRFTRVLPVTSLSHKPKRSPHSFNVTDKRNNTNEWE